MSVGAAPEAPQSRLSPLVFAAPAIGAILVLGAVGVLAYWAYPVRGTEIAGAAAAGLVGIILAFWASSYRERKEREKMNAHVAANADLVAPVEGVSLDDYARACLGAASGNFAAVLGELGMDMAKYERVAAGWNAKMAGDATGTVARLYGEAFTRVR